MTSQPTDDQLQRWAALGLPTPAATTTPPKLSTSERFWSYVMKEPHPIAPWDHPDCWRWEYASTSGRGHGQFWDGKRLVGAHRWAHEEAFGPIPAGASIGHSCGLTSCVRPDHLLLRVSPRQASAEAMAQVAEVEATEKKAARIAELIEWGATPAEITADLDPMPNRLRRPDARTLAARAPKPLPSFDSGRQASGRSVSDYHRDA